MDAWLMVFLGIVLIFMTIAQRRVLRIIPILAGIIGVILIGFGVKDFINGG